MDLLDVFGIFFIIFTIATTFIISFYVYVYFSHPLEKEYKGSWVGRIIIVTGMVLIFCFILFIVIDYMCNYKNKNTKWGFNYNLDIFWISFFYTILLSFIANYFFIKFYRNIESEGVMRKCLWAGLLTLIPVTVYTLVAVNYFWVKGFSKGNNIESYYVDVNSLLKSEDVGTQYMQTKSVSLSYKYNNYNHIMFLSPLILVCAFFFSIFGGAGLAIFPINIIKMFVNRPKEVTAEDIVFAKCALKKASEELIVRSKEIYNLKRDLRMNLDSNSKEIKRKNKVISEKYTLLKRDVLDYEEKYQAFKNEEDILNHNPAYYLGCLVAGVLCGFFSLIFFFDTIFSMFDIKLLMDQFLLAVRGVNTSYSLIVLMLMCFYVLVAVTKSSYEISKYLYYVFEAFPIKLNRTWTDGFMTNNIIVLFSLVGFVTFLVRNCENYFSYLHIGIFMNSIMKNDFIEFFYKKNFFRLIFIFSFVFNLFIILMLHTGKESLEKSANEIRENHYRQKNNYQLISEEP